jgi:hypothetical protein
MHNPHFTHIYKSAYATIINVMSRNKFAGIFILLAVLVLVVIGGIVYVVRIYAPQMATQNNAPASMPAIPTSSSTASGATIAPTATGTSGNSADIDAVKAALAVMRQGISSGNSNLVLEYVSTKTASEISAFGGKFIPPNVSIAVNNVFQSGANIVADITTSVVNGASAKVDWVFINEGGAWKFDLDATVAYEKSKNNTP